jgi:hypothetical protein
MSITAKEFIQAPVTPGGLSVTADSYDAGSITTAALAAKAVTLAKQATFVSTVQTGTGSSQSIAHGLGVTPSAVFVSFTGSTSSQAVTEGSHTSTNVVVTVTSAATFKVIAFA